MTAYRLASRRYAADNSEGARRYGGRWNRPGTPVIYCSSSRSLAAIEVLARHRAIPVDYVVIVVRIPDDMEIETVQLIDLPSGWPDAGTADETAEFGTQWALSLRTPVLRVPSAVVRDESNYLLNPLHSAFDKIRFEVPIFERIDPRLQG